jgi:type II secretory pathway pseudopilin PulG
MHALNNIQPGGDAMKRNQFNMIEVVLALGVVAIGAVSLMALFPVGFDAGRNAAAQSFAADSADQFLHWFAARARNDWATFLGGGSSLPIPGQKPFSLDANDMETDNWTGGTQTVTPTLTLTRHTTDGLLKVQMTGNAADFSGIYRIWKDTVTVPYIDASGVTENPVPLDTASAVAVNLEVSWPSQLPYRRREKHVYRLEIFKPEY